MTALERLWKSAADLQLAERAYWTLAAELLEEGLIGVEDAAEIYGIHPQTARKRLASLHYHGT